MVVACLFNTTNAIIVKSVMQPVEGLIQPNMFDFVLFRSLPNIIFMFILSFYFKTRVFQLPKMTLYLRIAYVIRILAPSLTFFCMI